MDQNRSIIIIGYSGHSYVVIDSLISQGFKIAGYMDKEPKIANPYKLDYLGNENAQTAFALFKTHPYFVAIGDSLVRQKIHDRLLLKQAVACNAIHVKSIISSSARIGKGVAVMAGAIINSCVEVGDGVIINSSAVVEHECVVGDFSHVAPGAVLAGSVRVGNQSLIGANAVVKQGIAIGKNVIIGAGSVVIENIPDNGIWVGNPARKQIIK